MKKYLTILVALFLALGVGQALANEKVVIGGTPTPHVVILQQIKQAMADLGYDLEIVEFTDYVLPNPATSSGELQANYFQHLPFLNAYNDSVSEAEQLFAAIPVHYEPFGLYAGTKVALADLSEGDHIALTNDPANEVRGLLLLQEAGILTLREGIGPNSQGVTKEDIVDNPKGVVIDEMNAELIPSALSDVAFAVINGNYAIGAGLSPAKDALFLESAGGEAGKVYTNYVVVQAKDADADFVKALQKALYTQEIKDFILGYEDFQGGVIPAFEPLPAPID